MSKRPSGEANVTMCEKSGILIQKPCEPGECETCGWNPEVNRERRERIEWYAKKGILHLWGREESAAKRSVRVKKAIETIQREIRRIEPEGEKP